MHALSYRTATLSFFCSRRTRCSMISTALRMFLRICCILSRLSSLFSRRLRVCGRWIFSRVLCQVLRSHDFGIGYANLTQSSTSLVQHNTLPAPAPVLIPGEEIFCSSLLT